MITVQESIMADCSESMSGLCQSFGEDYSRNVYAVFRESSKQAAFMKPGTLFLAAFFFLKKCKYNVFVMPNFDTTAILQCGRLLEMGQS